MENRRIMRYTNPKAERPFRAPFWARMTGFNSR